MGKKDQLLGAKGFRATNWTEGNRKKRKFTSKNSEAQNAIKRRIYLERLEKQDPTDIYQEIESLEQHRERKKNLNARQSERLNLLKTVYNKVKDDTYSLKTEGIAFTYNTAQPAQPSNPFLMPQTYMGDAPKLPAQPMKSYSYQRYQKYDEVKEVGEGQREKKSMERQRAERRQKYSKREIDTDDPFLDVKFEQKREKKKESEQSRLLTEFERQDEERKEEVKEEQEDQEDIEAEEEEKEEEEEDDEDAFVPPALRSKPKQNKQVQSQEVSDLKRVDKEESQEDDGLFFKPALDNSEEEERSEAEQAESRELREFLQSLQSHNKYDDEDL